MSILLGPCQVTSGRNFQAEAQQKMFSLLRAPLHWARR